MNKVKNALELALGVFREPYCDAPLDDVIKACEEALNHSEENLDMVKQEQGEPVGRVVHMLGMTVGRLTKEVPVGTQLYTTPQQRTWVELTPEEISDIAINNPPAVHDFYQAIADALKKKNGYSA